MLANPSLRCSLALVWAPLRHMTGPGWPASIPCCWCPGTSLSDRGQGHPVPGRAPRLSAGEPAQMSAAWVDKVDNPAMAELGLASSDVYGGDVYGGLAIVNFVDLTWKEALTGDFLAFEPVAAQGQLVGLSWLVGRVGEGA